MVRDRYVRRQCHPAHFFLDLCLCAAEIFGRRCDEQIHDALNAVMIGFGRMEFRRNRRHIPQQQAVRVSSFPIHTFNGDVLQDL
jgi:hypothetical protein